MPPMVEVETQDGPKPRTLLLAKSNLSITLDRLAVVYLCLCAVTLLVAMLPAIMGFWPIIPIAIAHLLVVGWCLRRAWRGNWARERIEISAETVRVEHAALGDYSRLEWPTPWLKVYREMLPDGGIRVILGYHAQRIEIGAFLPYTERVELARALEAGLKPYSAWE